MAGEDASQKTEPATPKKREEARKKGEVAQSRDVSSVAVLIGAFAVLTWGAGSVLLQTVAAAARESWLRAAHPPDSLGEFQATFLSVAGMPALALLPFMIALAVAGTAAQVLQTGPVLASEALSWKPGRMDPIKGMKRLGNVESFFNLIKAIAKIALVFGVAWGVMSADLGTIVGLARVEVGAGLLEVGRLARLLLIVLLAVLSVLAIADFFFVRWRYEKKLRMSKQEVRDELKQREGDPGLRGRIRSQQRELSRSRMIAAVAEADVVITNPTHFAIALRYDRLQMAAPSVVARGRGHVALRIREAARKANVPIVENPPLARVLHDTTRVGREVPENLFQAVAEVLAYVYRLEPHRASRWAEGPA